MASQIKTAGTSSVLSATAVPLRMNKTTMRRGTVTVRAEQVTRREGLIGIATGVSALVSAAPSLAAYGEAANVFGKVTDTSGFIPLITDEYSLLVPSKWNPSKERDFPGVVARYEDNGDSVTNFIIVSAKTDKKSISDYGSQTDFLKEVEPYLGKQVFAGPTDSEGGFQSGKVATASLLDLASVKDKKGKDYYKYEILTRTADGDEGGRHQIIVATVSNGNLYLLKAQCGDKRWFKGADKSVTKMVDSFTVA
eukprot:g7934.t1